MPRSIWSGSISYGLVNVPVRLYSAVQEHKLRFHFVHEKDNSPIGYEKICKKEGKPVAEDEIVKAFEFEKGEYVFEELLEGDYSLVASGFAPVAAAVRVGAGAEVEHDLTLGGNR